MHFLIRGKTALKNELQTNYCKSESELLQLLLFVVMTRAANLMRLHITFATLLKGNKFGRKLFQNIVNTHKFNLIFHTYTYF